MARNTAPPTRIPVAIEKHGKTHWGQFYVQGRLVTVMHEGRTKIAQLGGSPAEATAKQLLSVLVGDAPQDFIRILNLTPGASVSADFIACVRDISTTFVLPDGQNQSAAKQKIKKRLRELKLSGGEEGIAKLAAAEIKFAARDD